MRNFESDFRSIARVEMDWDDLERAEDFAARIARHKTNGGERAHNVDGGQEVRRWTTGVLGEMALERYLGASFIDWTLGSSADYDRADLAPLGLDVGVKTVEYGKYPVVHKNPRRPEVILVKEGRMTVHVCGLASPEVMRAHADDGLILSGALRARGVKTGFWGFGELLPFGDLGDLRRLIDGS